MSLAKAKWNKISEKSDSVFLVEINHTESNAMQLDNRKFADFLTVDTYVNYFSGTLIVYKIEDRVTDQNGNLILFSPKRASL